jgi:acetyl-CoA acetyltransferase
MTTQCAVVGSAETAVGRSLGRSALDLRLEAATSAIRDAGLNPNQIDGMIVRQPRRDPVQNYSAFLAEQLGLHTVHIQDVALSGAGSVAMVVAAVTAIRAGLATTILCVGGDAATTLNPRQRRGNLASLNQDFRHPYGADGAPIVYGLIAQRHMHEYGTTSRQLGAIAVACRRHASLNPNAQMRTPITIEEHQMSPFVAEPLRRLDCSLVSEGAGAVVVTTAERARDFPHPPVYILGVGNACRYSEATYHWPLHPTAAHDASRQAFAQAGVTPADVDVIEFYDCFTHVPLIQIEDYGFCHPGEGGAFVEGGRIELGGELPLNTHGGLLSQAHIGGMLHITEGVTQIRGEAGPRQVQGAKIAAVSGECAELGIHMSLILGSEAS